MDFIYEGEENGLTEEELLEFIREHQSLIPRYEELKKQYESKPPILDMAEKEAWKPDNRLVVNFGKYIVDTFNGYFSGIPVKISHEHEELNKAINEFWNLNDMDDTLSELSKLTSIYGVSYLYIWQDEDAKTSMIHNSPLDMFVIYDDSIEGIPIYAVRYKVKDNKLQGTLITRHENIEFMQGKSELVFEGRENHYYPILPVIPFVENEEEQSLIEPVETLINAFNKSISEKTNDVDYFADAYLAILGVELDEEGTHNIRDNRIINMFGEEASKILVQFLDKPDGDVAQENLLNRLERLIYHTSMVANINDESFGNASGVSLEFKLQPMKNLASMKERKFTRSLNKLFKIFMALPTNVPASNKDEWINVQYRFTRNIPRNITDEVTAARELEGVVSKGTQLSVLSIVDNVQEEINRMDEENEPPAYNDTELSFNLDVLEDDPEDGIDD